MSGREIPTALELATVDELVAELRKRLKSFVFVGRASDGEDYDWRYAWEHPDGFVGALGMTELFKIQALVDNHVSKKEQE